MQRRSLRSIGAALMHLLGINGPQGKINGRNRFVQTKVTKVFAHHHGWQLDYIFSSEGFGEHFHHSFGQRGVVVSGSSKLGLTDDYNWGAISGNTSGQSDASCDPVDR